MTRVASWVALPSLALRYAPVALALGLAPRALAQMPVFEPAGQEAHATPAATEPTPPLAPPETSPATAPAAPPGVHPTPAHREQLVEPRTPEREPPNDEEGEPLERTKPPRRWYGWQTLTADGISLLSLITAAAVDRSDGSEASSDASQTLVWAGVLGYEFAPGILHFVHRNPGRAFASFGMRLGMPLAGAILGAAAANCRGADCRSRGAGAGFLMGMGGAMALDAAVLAYENAPPLDRSRVLPIVQVSGRSAWVGVAGEL